jgi:hypothetical protein
MAANLSSASSAFCWLHGGNGPAFLQSNVCWVHVLLLLGPDASQSHRS